MYGPNERVHLCRALARHGRNVEKTRAWLRSQLDGEILFPRVGKNVLRALVKSRKYGRIIEEEYQLWLTSEREGVAEATRESARRNLEGTVIQKMAKLEEAIDDAMVKVKELLATKEIKPEALVKCLDVLARIADRRKDRLIPVLAEISDCAYLIDAVTEVLIAKFGPARMKPAMQEIGTQYQAKKDAAERARFLAAAQESAG